MKNYVSVPKDVAMGLPDEAFMFPAERGYPDAANAPNMLRERRGMGVVVQPEYMPVASEPFNESSCPPQESEQGEGQFDLF